MERWYPSIQVYNIIIFQINLNYSVQHSTQVYIISIQIAINNLKVSLSPNNSGFSFLNRKRHLLEKHPFLKFHTAKPVKNFTPQTNDNLHKNSLKKPHRDYVLGPGHFKSTGPLMNINPVSLL